VGGRGLRGVGVGGGGTGREGGGGGGVGGGVRGGGLQSLDSRMTWQGKVFFPDEMHVTHVNKSCPIFTKESCYTYVNA